MPRAKVRATDLTAPAGNLYGLTGQPMVDVARATLEAGSSMVQAWRDLEPIVRQLTAKARQYVGKDEVHGPEAAKLLGLTANVVHKVGAAAQGMLRTTEGMSRLALLMEGGTTRLAPKAMSEKQLAAVVIETAKKIWKEQGHCPVCATDTVDVTPDAG